MENKKKIRLDHQLRLMDQVSLFDRFIRHDGFFSPRGGE